jgi:hypothetical protein
MPLTADRCKETSTTTGTGTMTLAGAVSQYASFNSSFGVNPGVLIQYAIVEQSGTAWECGLGYLTSSTTLTREKVYSSSNGNSLVNFGAGTKDVFATFLADLAENATVGSLTAISRGMAMP